MAIFDSIEDIFQKWRGYDDNAKALVTFATALGVILIFYYAIKCLWGLVGGFRLYVLSQICRPTDFRKKYGEWVVISGATDGIGLAMAREFGRRGHSLVIIGRNEEKLANSKRSLEEEPNVGEVVTVKIDLSDSSIANFERAKTIIDPENRDIGILVNNAGIFPPELQRFHQFDLDYIRLMTNTNILAVEYLTRMMIPGMLKRERGCIVNVSSMFGFCPTPYMCIYPATKVFVDTFSSLLQSEYEPYPIDIVNIAPGAVFTRPFISLSNQDKPTKFVVPTADEYANSAINALSVGIKTYSGCIVHAIQTVPSYIVYQLGLSPFLTRFLHTVVKKNNNLVPIIGKVSKSSQASVPETTEAVPLDLNSPRT